MVGHSRRHVFPSTEGVAHFVRHLGQLYLCAIAKYAGAKNLVVNIEGHGVRVGGKGCRDGHVVGWHCGGHFAPSAESVALLGGRFGRGDCSSVVERLAGVFFAVNDVGDGVLLDDVPSRYCKIAVRHVFGKITPARKAIAFPWGRIIYRTDRIAECYVVGLVNLAIDYVCELIFVDSKCACHHYIVAGHGGGHSLPSAEGVAPLGGRFGRGDRSSVVESLAGVFLAIDYVCESIFIDSESACHHYIVAGHCGGHVLPSAEGVALLGGGCYRSDAGSLLHTENFILLTVNLIGKIKVMRAAIGLFPACTIVVLQYPSTGFCSYAIRRSTLVSLIGVAVIYKFYTTL